MCVHALLIEASIARCPLCAVQLPSAGSHAKKVTRRLLPRDISNDYDAFVNQLDTILSDDIISVDETAVYAATLPTHGYARRGQRVFQSTRVPKSRQRFSVVLAATSTTVFAHHIAASFNTQSFLIFVRSLAHLPQRYVLLDNVRFHHSACVREAIASMGKVVVYVPPYSPECNPVEMVIHSFKNAFRRLVQHEGTNHIEECITSALSLTKTSPALFEHSRKESRSRLDDMRSA